MLKRCQVLNAVVVHDKFFKEKHIGQRLQAIYNMCIVDYKFFEVNDFLQLLGCRCRVAFDVLPENVAPLCAEQPPPRIERLRLINDLGLRLLIS